MPITIKRRLILVEANPKEWTSKQTGDIVKKWRYKFVDKDLNYYVAYDDFGTLKNNVETIEGWDETKAKDYQFAISEFNGVKKEKLFIPIARVSVDGSKPTESRA